MLSRTLHRILILALLLSAFGGWPQPTRADDGQPPQWPPDVLLGDPASTPAAPAIGEGGLPIPSGCSSGTNNFNQTPNAVISDNTTITQTINVAGGFSYLWDITLSMVISHTFAGDLDIVLISPQGTHVTITTDNGGGADNVFSGTVWSDAWQGASLSDYVYTTNVVVPTISPEEAMGAFRGQDMAGNWRLVITDDANGDVGVLKTWGLSISSVGLVAGYSNSFYTSPNTSIADLTTYTQTLSVNGMGDVLGDVNLYTSIIHTNTSDLNITLISPTGLTATVTSGNGGDKDDLFSDTLWDDAAGDLYPPGPVTDQVFTDSVTAPGVVVENALSTFNQSGSTNGDWTLVVRDTTANSSSGYIYTWGLIITTYSCRPDLNTYNVAHGFPDKARFGVPITSTLKLQNNGILAAQNVIFTSTLGNGGVFMGLTPPPTAVCATSPIGTLDGAFNCSLASVAATTLVPFTVAVGSPATPNLYVAASLQSSTTSQEPNTANNNTTTGLSHFFLTSANNNFWDIGLTKGDIVDGGQDAFDNWGAIRIQVINGGFTQTLVSNTEVTNLGLTYTGNRGWATTSAQTYADIQVSREAYAPAYANYIRYMDTFTNTSSELRHVYVAWGGDLGSDSNTTVAATSSGNSMIEIQSDTWAVTTQNLNPASDPPVGYAFRGASDPTAILTGRYDTNPFNTPWPGASNDDLSYVFALDLVPGQTGRLAYFLYRGLAENTAGPLNCAYYSDCVTPANDTEVAKAKVVVAALSLCPDFINLPLEVRANIKNWPNANACALYLPAIQK